MSTENEDNGYQLELEAEGGVLHTAHELDATPQRHGGSKPLPRPERRRRKAKLDRGLPPDPELAKLANAYLERQFKLWPTIAAAGLLPAPTDRTIRDMVEDFKERHRTGTVDVASVRPFAKFSPKLGGSYNRFSCDNSNPMSVIDQMVNCLEKGHAEGRFIPWQYVSADYSVTGLDATRQGYTSYKAMLADDAQLIETTYIDDFTRASRDEIEWWILAALSKRLNKRMIGASDGFDVSSPDWDLKLTMYGLLSRLFIKGLREKVRRGMKGAGKRGTCLGKQSLGFTRRKRLDEHGNIVRGPDSLPIYEPCIDPATREYRLLAYELFVERNWSAYRISKHFSQLNVDGWGGWTETTIKKLLSNPTSIGVFIWNRTRREFDLETRKWHVVKNPRSEWAVRYDRELAIAPMEWYRAARRKLAAARRASPMTGRKLSRNQVSATTLFSGTLFCHHCGGELKLIRSTPKYKQLGCHNGRTGSHGCPVTVSKSVRVVEECLLTFIRDNLLDETAIARLTEKANDAVEREARKPRTNVAPLKADARKLEAKIQKNVRMIEETDDTSLTASFHTRVMELQRELNRLKVEIRDAEVRNGKPVKPLEVAFVRRQVALLWTLMQGDIPAAAEAIRQLTGRITIRQEAIKGRKRGARWIAQFNPDFLRLLGYLSAGDPRLQSLASCDAVSMEPVELSIEKVPRYEILGQKFREMKENGASVNTIASAHGMCWKDVNDAIHFAESGERPNYSAGKRTGNGAKPAKFKAVAEQVARLHEREKMTFAAIAEKLGMAGATVRRAYDLARPEAVKQAAAAGTLPDRGPSSTLGEATYRKIRKLIAKGKKDAEIAKDAGCGQSTVRRTRQKMEENKKNDDAA